MSVARRHRGKDVMLVKLVIESSRSHDKVETFGVLALSHVLSGQLALGKLQDRRPDLPGRKQHVGGDKQVSCSVECRGNELHVRLRLRVWYNLHHLTKVLSEQFDVRFRRLYAPPGFDRRGRKPTGHCDHRWKLKVRTADEKDQLLLMIAGFFGRPHAEASVLEENSNVTRLLIEFLSAHEHEWYAAPAIILDVKNACGERCGSCDVVYQLLFLQPLHV